MGKMLLVVRFRPLKPFVVGPLVGLLYLMAAWIGYELRMASGLPPMIWFASGVAVAAFAVGGLHLWPWIAVSALAFDLVRGFPLASAPVMAFGNTVGPWLGVFLLQKYSSPRPTLKKVREVRLFLILVLGLGSFVGSGVESLGLWAGGSLVHEGFLVTWADLWLDEAMGALIVGAMPIVLLNGARDRTGPSPRWEWSILSVLGAALAVGLVCYTPLARFNQTILIRPFLLYPIIIWAGVRYGSPGALGVLVLTGICVSFGVLNQTLPSIITGRILDQMFFQECIILILGITGLVVAAAVHEKEDALQIRQGFLSFASHELRTPLTSLKLQAQVRRRRVAKGDFSLFAPDRLANLVESDERQINRLSRLVEDMFDISRLTAGKFTIRRERVELVDLVKDIVARMRVQLEAFGSELIFQAPESGTVVGHWDHFRLEQAISNLLTNAMKYGGGKPVQVQVASAGKLAKISVRDQGVGIAPQDHARIFNQFERA
jgi:signal transduction histidine kinase